MRSDSSPSMPAACATSRLASTCGRCDTHAISRSWVSASIAQRARADAAEQAVQALVQDARGAAFGGRQVPGGAVEQIVARVLHAGRLGARERVPADEALVAGGVREHALGRADVADDAVGAGGLQRQAHRLGERAHGRRGEHDVGAGDRGGDVVGLFVDRAQREREGAHVAGRGRSRTRSRRRGCARPGRSSRRSARRRGPRSASAQGCAVCALGRGCERVRTLPAPPAPRRSSPSRCSRR